MTVTPTARPPAAAQDTAMVEVDSLVKSFPLRHKLFAPRTRAQIRAVDGVSFSIMPGRTLALVGESGCGKSTTARTILRLIEPTSGSVRIDGKEITTLGRADLRQARCQMQMVFQDPYASLNPRMTIGQILAEKYRILNAPLGSGTIAELLSTVGLGEDYADRYPHEMSGGQRQRVGIARAIALHPKLIVLDEPVSALDVSIQAQVINLLEDLQDELQLTYLFIAHDLSVVRHIADEVAVMYLGAIVEIADRNAIFEQPHHPYTQALMSAVPIPDPERERRREHILLQGDVPSPANPPPGCRFHTRCWKYRELGEADQERCRTVPPQLLSVAASRTEPAFDIAPAMSPQGRPDHRAACHFPEVRVTI